MYLNDLHWLSGVAGSGGASRVGRHAARRRIPAQSEFDVSKEKFLLLEMPETNLSIRTAAKTAALVTGQGFVRCVCKKA
ncbi:unnamed protein product, partial [Timema podura]|nr:unnamed protein product [Timema podura]